VDTFLLPTSLLSLSYLSDVSCVGDGISRCLVAFWGFDLASCPVSFAESELTDKRTLTLDMF
jgi:hypothetical protein